MIETIVGILAGVGFGLMILSIMVHFRRDRKKVKIDIRKLENEVFGLKRLSDTHNESWMKLWREHPELFNKKSNIKSNEVK